MKYTYHFFSIALVFTLFTFAHAQKKQTPITAFVTLSPLGSFELTSTRVFGKAKKKKDAYIAKELKVPVNMLKTGMSLRDKHLKEKLEFATHKNIIVTDAKAKAGKGQAKITIKGVTKPVSFTVKDLGNNKAQANFSLALKDFGISGISYQGVGVKDKVDVQAIIDYDEVQ